MGLLDGAIFPEHEELNEDPLFYAESPDGERDVSEIVRCVRFRKLCANALPKVKLWANANAGRRNPMQARREGILAGVFDYTAVWTGGFALIEFKGYSKRRPGKLSPQQISFGNAMVARGHNAACFFDPVAAVEWLKKCGAPQ